MKTNVLYYGDNLKVLRDHIPDESVDLIYLDPPFNSQQDYNILFREATGEKSQAQIRAFTDSWHWGKDAEETYQDIVLHAPMKVSKATEAVSAGFHHSERWGRDIPRLQVLTIEEVLAGKQPDVPRGGASPYAKAERIVGEGERGSQLALGGDGAAQPAAVPTRRRRTR